MNYSKNKLNLWMIFFCLTFVIAIAPAFATAQAPASDTTSTDTTTKKSKKKQRRKMRRQRAIQQRRKSKKRIRWGGERYGERQDKTAGTARQQRKKSQKRARKRRRREFRKRRSGSTAEPGKKSKIESGRSKRPHPWRGTGKAVVQHGSGGSTRASIRLRAAKLHRKRRRQRPPVPIFRPPQTSGKVWVNTESGVYHKSGRWYGKTKQGKFMTEDEAKAAGYKAAQKE